MHHVSPRAKADLDDIWRYLREESGREDIADRQIDALTERFFLLSEHPRAGRLRPELGSGRRSFPVDRYVIVYRVTGGDVVILRVAHGSRDLRALMSSR